MFLRRKCSTSTNKNLCLLLVTVAPKFTIQPQNPTEAIEGYPVMLHCAAEGDPKPTIQWDRDSRMNNLNNSRFEVLGNGSLYIKEVYMSDEGKYGCTAGNSGGLKREEVQLNVRGKWFFAALFPYAGIQLVIPQEITRRRRAVCLQPATRTDSTWTWKWATTGR